LKVAFPRKSANRRPPADETALYEYALKALGRRMRTEVELRRLLDKRADAGQGGQSVIAAVVARLKERGYLDDRSYAETYTRLRKENEKLGPRRVRQSLRQKGIPSGLADSTVEEAYSATSEEALARRHLERKRIGKPRDEKETARLVRRLLSAGFSNAVIYRILRQWDVSDQSLASLDSLADESSQE
jgi:regulatory protein